MDTMIFYFEIGYFELIKSSMHHQNNMCERKIQTKVQNCIFKKKSEKNK